MIAPGTLTIATGIGDHYENGGKRLVVVLAANEHPNTNPSRVLDPKLGAREWYVPEAYEKGWEAPVQRRRKRGKVKP